MSSKATILFVDDEARSINRLRALCKDRFNLLTTANPVAALDFIRNHTVHVVISDQAMPKMQGIDLLREVREISPQTIRILLTGYADLAAIIGSVNEGEIYRYLYKPWSNKDMLNAIEASAEVALSYGAAETPQRKKDARAPAWRRQSRASTRTHVGVASVVPK